MARKRDPRRDEARNIWLNTNGDKPLKDIAELLGVSDSQIRKWKSIDKWSSDLKGNVTNGKSNVTNQGGAPFGNENGKGNKGNSRASSPKNNKNALKTGEHETIFAAYLTDEEKDVYSSVSDDPFFVVSEEIKLLKVRQLRMMKRIQEAEKGLNQKETESLYQLREVKKSVSVESRKKPVTVKSKEMQEVQRTEKTERKIADILAIEDALTRVSNQLHKSAKMLKELSDGEDKQTEALNKFLDKLSNKT